MIKFFLILIGFSYIYAESFFDIQRRRDQYPSTPGYLAAPAAYSLPGIGSGFLFLGMANNIYDTQTDLVLDVITGDVEGYGFGISDLYLIDKTLKVELLQSNFEKATIQSYSSRGMDSNGDDYLLLELGSSSFTGIRTTASFNDKMFELYLMTYFNRYSLSSIMDKDGAVILDAANSPAYDMKTFTFGFMLDYTDDRVDPRKGVRFDSSINYTPQEDAQSVNYYVTNYNFTYYIPIGRQSTWAFNYYRSDANVIKQGETDYTALSDTMGLDCSSLSDLEEIRQCESVINNAIAANRYGTATSLGGRGRLRSYPEGRFSGAHTQFYGTEFRWNITDESSPFDIWLMKDIRTSVQSAFFYERGSVSDSASELWKNESESYGVGVRVITASGLVYRLDVASGGEGEQVTLIINYPWEIF